MISLLERKRSNNIEITLKRLRKAAIIEGIAARLLTLDFDGERGGGLSVIFGVNIREFGWK